MLDGAHSGRKTAILTDLGQVVVKIGSGVLADANGLDASVIARIASEVAEVRARGLAVTIVSSGAIAAGRRVLGGKPRSIPERQAAAAVGQIDLMSQYRDAFARHGVAVAQILLDAADLADRQRYLNAEHTLATLHQKGIIPIVNENDTVAVDELKFGDNDNLSALVAILVGAGLLVILSDVEALFTADPSLRPDARRVPVLAEVDDAALGMTGEGAGRLGTGGMRSKLLAARKAAAGGIATIIAGGRTPGILARVLEPSADVGTLVLPGADRLAKRKHWIAYALPPRGELRCDAGAAAAVRGGGRSLLPSGVVSVSGQFAAGDCVRLLDPDGREFGRGLSSYHAAEATRIAGRRSAEVESLLGYSLGDAVVHRDDLVLTEPGTGAKGTGSDGDDGG
jgi:glutamate 5-kinase